MLPVLVVLLDIGVTPRPYCRTDVSALLLPAACVEVQHNGDLLQYYHPGVFTSNKWTCCHHNSRLSLGCKATFVNRRKQEEQQRVAMQQDNMMAAPGGGMGPGPSVPPPARPGVSAPGGPGAAVGGYSRSLPPVPNAGPPGSAGPPVAGGPHMNGVGGHQPQLPFQASNTLPQPPQQAAAQVNVMVVLSTVVAQEIRPASRK